ncbi:pseudouridine synthase [Acrocarpospora catenulata]|uniref:pseudouridine synthase n=1 Tax=Acrocarpospora catenulata TaxID=2836182 RepID=UPI001BDB02DC|nr:pseudouridine synthase [Acrocarpospora catenulata]
MNKHSTPSGDGRGRGRSGGAPRGGRDGRPSFRADRDGNRGGNSGGNRGGYGRPAPRERSDRRDERGSADRRPYDGPRERSYDGPRDDRGASRDSYGRRDARDGGRGGYGRDRSREDVRGSYGRSESRGYNRGDSQDRGYNRGESQDRGYNRSDSQDRGYNRSDSRDRGYGRGDDSRGSQGRFTRPEREERSPHRNEGRYEDRNERRYEGRSEGRGEGRNEGGGTRARYGRPEGGRGGYGDSRSNDRSYDRDGGSRGYREGNREGSRDRDYGRPGQDRPRQDRPGQDRPRQDRPRQDRPRYDRPAGDDRGGFRGDRGGARRDVQTLGGGSRGRFGRNSSRSDFRTARPGGTDEAFKSARQPRRDPDFYDAGYTDERDTTEVPGGERLQKVLAQAGVASRRACEDMIGDGRVTVDGQVVRRFGARVDPAKQVIHVDGKRIPTAPDLVYYALNKPIGVVSTMEDPEGRRCLRDFVQELAPRLFHVGRLDTETEGLLLLTNDGELAHRLTHPSYGVKKKYWAKVPGPVSRDLHRVLRKGIELEDGLAKVDEFHIVQEHGQQALVEVVLHEGRKHIVRRLLEESGHRVIDLARIEFGPVKLGRLKPGTVRALTLQEVGELYAAVKL